jgi:hypothetical protein
MARRVRTTSPGRPRREVAESWRRALSCEAVELTPPTPPALLVGRGAVLEGARVSVAGTNDAVLRKRGLTFSGWAVGVGRTEDIQLEGGGDFLISS